MSAETAKPDIELPRPHPAQQAVLDSPKRFRLLNCGRRWGKSRLCLILAVIGDAQAKGMAAGGQWAWVAPDFPQARAIWREEILPRFSGKEALGVTVSETDKRVELPGGGSLTMRSAENVDSLRGLGLDGVIVDEAAHQDLQYSWEQVIRPALLDRRGVAVFPSSPNGGRDGNPEHIIPSYFNRLCQRAQQGDLSEEWGYWHFTTRDNPFLPREVVEQEYRDASPLARQQELDAELVMGGGGLAFPEWNPKVHLKAFPDSELLERWTWWAGLDWGYTADGVYTLLCVSPGGEDYHFRWDCRFSRLTPEQAVAKIVAGHRQHGFPFPRFVGCDSAMQQRSGVRSVWEAFSEAWKEALGPEGKDSHLVPVAKTGVDGKGHRESRKLLWHELLAYQAQPDGSVRDWDRPALTVHPDAGTLRSTIPLLMQTPIPGEEDVDTSGNDHGYDSAGYALWLRPQGIAVAKQLPPKGILLLNARGEKQRPWRDEDERPTKRYGVRRTSTREER